MRITTKYDTQPAFKPVVVEITCESQDELESINTVLASALIDDACKLVWPSLAANRYSIGNPSELSGITRTAELKSSIVNLLK